MHVVRVFTSQPRVCASVSTYTGSNILEHVKEGKKEGRKERKEEEAGEEEEEEDGGEEEEEEKRRKRRSTRAKGNGG